MKRLKSFFSVLIVLTLLLGLFLNFRQNSSHIEHTEFLFDTACSITVFSGRDKSAITQAFDEAARIHKLSSFFDDSSDVSKINVAKANQKVSVDRSIIDMLELAEEIRIASDGAFDISIAPVSVLWKFDTESPVPPTDKQISDALKLSGGKKLFWDKATLTVSKELTETKIDLGGIAKGYAADKAAKILKEVGVSAAIIDFGGNIITLGKNPNSADGLWRIGLQTPFAASGEYSKTLTLGSCAVATSGSYQRSFVYDKTLYHHIIDPKTGRPAAADFSSITITAESSALADCLSTAGFVLGREKALTLAKQYNASAEFLQ